MYNKVKGDKLLVVVIIMIFIVFMMFIVLFIVFDRINCKYKFLFFCKYIVVLKIYVGE